MKQEMLTTFFNITISNLINLIFVGLIITFWLTPIAQRHTQERELFYKKKIELAENSAIDFTLYRLNRQRLISINIEELKGKDRGWKLDQQFYNNKLSYQHSRDVSREQLYKDLQLATLFFSHKIIKENKNFIAWDSFYSNKNTYSLPNDEEMEVWQNKLIGLMKKELST